MLTERDCRKRAADFYLRSINGVTQEWIDSGDDERFLRDNYGSVGDICDCARLLWSAVQDDRRERQ